MEIYAKSYDIKVWRVIKKENYPLPAVAQPPADPEDIDEYTDGQMTVVQVNAKVRNLLYNAISGEEYEKISTCNIAKEMWDKLEVTYEGTSKIKEGESIEEMFAGFSKIISDLKAFGTPYSRGYQVRKIMRSLPTTWQTKVVALESQYLNKLSYDEPRGDLIAFKKTQLKKTNQEEKKKTIAFKATTERTNNDIDDDPKALEEEIAMFRCWIDEDASDDECKDDNENCFMARGETSEVRSYNRERCNELQDILYLTLKESQKMMNELKRLNREKKLEEHHRKSRKEKWYLNSVCSRNMTVDKNLFKEVTRINRRSVKFGDDSKRKIVGTCTVPFNNNCDITEVYLIDGLNYILLSLRQLCDSRYEVKFKKTCCTVEDKTNEALKNFEIISKRVEREKRYLITTIHSDHGRDFKEEHSKTSAMIKDTPITSQL
ncbi:uncharacterized protein LOC142182172 [Nicotiana tabacum]|uniref:Uncharacterized protein LOC142182172 n=1 Tax=Nicotiana tabacum TaxID=4097 RepID=A0AC58US07_TOBAC